MCEFEFEAFAQTIALLMIKISFNFPFATHFLLQFWYRNKITPSYGVSQRVQVSVCVYVCVCVCAIATRQSVFLSQVVVDSSVVHN